MAAFMIAHSPDLLALPPGLQVSLSLLPFAFLLLGLWIGLRFLHHRPFHSILRPDGRIRWGYLFLSGGLWLAISAAGDLVLSRLLPNTYHFSFHPAAFWPYLVAVILFIPVQVLAEEAYFRGYLTQGVGLAFGPLAGWLIPAFLFGLLHSYNPEVGAYGFLFTLPIYIGFGLILGWITLRTAGLEMALGLHLANNLYGTIFVSASVSALGGPSLFKQDYNAPTGLVVFLISAFIYLVLLAWIGRRKFLPGGGNLLALLVLLLPLFFTACTPGTHSQAMVVERSIIPLTDCLLNAPGQGQVKALCGRLAVTEDPGSTDPVISKKKIDLNIAVIQAVSRSPAPDPIFLLAGGPGQAATEAFLAELPAMERLRFKRDLVLVDQRGTGASYPLKCSASLDLGGLSGVVAPLEKQLAEIDRCRTGINADPRLYTTEIAMHDLDQVRQALGYQTINLLGVSYGTRAALVYLRLFPEHTRSLILDGVVPPDWPLGANAAADSQRALGLIFKRCAADAACQAAFPRLQSEFDRLYQALKKQPIEVTVPQPASGKPTRVQINPNSFGVTVRQMSYSDKLAALLPLSIHRAALGDYSLLAAQYLLVSTGLDESISMGMYYSVVCAEDAPYLPAQPENGNFYYSFDLDLMRAACKHWMPDPPSISHAAFNSKTAVFLISGDADPVTPPENGVQVSKLLPNSLNLVLPGLGHNNFYAGCVPDLLLKFLESGSPNGMDTTCVQKIHPLPFFLTPAGPVP